MHRPFGPSVASFLQQAEESLVLLTNQLDETQAPRGGRQLSPKAGTDGTGAYGGIGGGRMDAGPRRNASLHSAHRGGLGRRGEDIDGPALRRLAESDDEVQQHLGIMAKTLLEMDKRLRQLEGRSERRFDPSPKEEESTSPSAEVAEELRLIQRRLEDLTVVEQKIQESDEAVSHRFDVVDMRLREAVDDALEGARPRLEAQGLERLQTLLEGHSTHGRPEQEVESAPGERIKGLEEVIEVGGALGERMKGLEASIEAMRASVAEQLGLVSASIRGSHELETGLAAQMKAWDGIFAASEGSQDELKERIADFMSTRRQSFSDMEERTADFMSTQRQRFSDLEA